MSESHADVSSIYYTSSDDSSDGEPERKKHKKAQCGGESGGSHPERAPTVLDTLKRIVKCVVCHDIQPGQMFKHCQASLLCRKCFDRLPPPKRCAGCRQEGVYKRDFTAEEILEKHYTYPCSHLGCSKVFPTAEECKDHVLNHEDHMVESGCTIKVVSNPTAECDDRPMQKVVLNGDNATISCTAGDTKWVYKGPIVNGARKGSGTLTRYRLTKQISKQVSHYDGQFDENKRHGKGSYSDEFIVYDGEWKDDLLHGEGTRTVKCSAERGTSIYTGTFLGGEPHGHGTLRFNSGDVHEGMYSEGLRNGEGTQTHANGDVYTGDFMDDEFNGGGTMKYASGKTYVGDWENGHIQGEGKMTYADGSTHEGQWSQGRPFGKGTRTERKELIDQPGVFAEFKRPGHWDGNNVVGDPPPIEVHIPGARMAKCSVCGQVGIRGLDIAGNQCRKIGLFKCKKPK